jgi:hypothetical protein
MTVLLRFLRKRCMPREQFEARRTPSPDPPSAGLTPDETADYVRLRGLGENLERDAARWAREQERELSARQRRGRDIVLAATVVIAMALALVGLLVSARSSRRPRLPPSV